MKAETLVSALNCIAIELNELFKRGGRPIQDVRDLLSASEELANELHKRGVSTKRLTYFWPDEDGKPYSGPYYTVP